MKTLFRVQSHKAGLPPGALVPVGEKKVDKVTITVIDYDAASYSSLEAGRVEDCFPFKDKPTVSWINVNGLHDTDILKKLGEHYGIHALTLEDILNTDHRPKMEEFESYIFITLKMIYADPDEGSITSEQVSLVMGEGFVISFQESAGDVFEAVRGRLKKAAGRIRKRGSDYLGYALLDAVVDNYFIVLESLGAEIESLEDELTVGAGGQEALGKIYNLRRDTMLVKRHIGPLREAVGLLNRSDSGLITDATHAYLRDAYDHLVSVMDGLESFREMLVTMLEIHLSSMSNTMNRVMKVLTIIATIFIPLTFIAGIYGMNFKYMPELDHAWGYPIVLIIMALVGVVMIIFFRKKKWL